MKNLLKEVKVRIPNLDGSAVRETKTVKVPVAIDPDTGEELLTEDAIRIIDDTKARHMGLLLPAEIKSLRRQMGLTQKQISELIQAGEKSYTRWESGRARPSRVINVLLRLMYSGKVTVDDLRSISSRGADLSQPPRLMMKVSKSEINRPDVHTLWSAETERRTVRRRTHFRSNRLSRRKSATLATLGKRANKVSRFNFFSAID